MYVQLCASNDLAYQWLIDFNVGIFPLFDNKKFITLIPGDKKKSFEVRRCFCCSKIPTSFKFNYYDSDEVEQKFSSIF